MIRCNALLKRRFGLLRRGTRGIYIGHLGRRLVLLWRHEEAQLRMLVLRLRGLHVVRVHRRMQLRSLEVRRLRGRWCIREGAWGMRRMRLGRL